MAKKIGDIETGFGVKTQDADISREEYAKLPKAPIYFVLDNLRSAFNVGAFFRLGDILRVSGIYLCGYTAYPPHIKLEKTSLGTIDFVNWKHFEETSAAINELKAQNVEVWAAETAYSAVRYDKLPLSDKSVAFVFGNEALGVSQEVLQICDGIVEIPVFGLKNSMNVVSAAAVLGFETAKRLNLFEKLGEK
ncbi:MAG: RNA methyltransferase [Chitinivibrionia bacterium]|nr:RNA methyltransferase [Chitinivibrionia bacterium]